MDALFDSLLGNARRLRHDVTKLIHIGSATTDHYVCIARADAPVKSFKEALTQEFLIGASQPGTSTRDYPAMLNNMTGAKIKQVSGYPGTREITLAIEKNEVQGLCGFSWSSLNAQKPDWVKSGFIRVIVQEHDKGNPDVNKMGVPLAVDFATSPENRKIMELVYSSETFGRPYLLAPDIPAERVAALRKAFMETMKDTRAAGGGAADRARHRSDLGRGPAGPGREDFRDADGFRREDQGRDGLPRAVDAAVTDRACGAPPPAPRPCRGPGRRRAEDRAARCTRSPARARLRAGPDPSRHSRRSSMNFLGPGPRGDVANDFPGGRHRDIAGDVDDAGTAIVRGVQDEAELRLHRAADDRSARCRSRLAPSSPRSCRMRDSRWSPAGRLMTRPIAPSLLWRTIRMTVSRNRGSRMSDVATRSCPVRKRPCGGSAVAGGAAPNSAAGATSAASVVNNRRARTRDTDFTRP